MSPEEFIGQTIIKMSKMGVKIVLDGTTKKVHFTGDNTNCSGWFDDQAIKDPWRYYSRPYQKSKKSKSYPEFVVATGKNLDQWIDVFLHESCHFDQWIEGDPTWKNSYISQHRNEDCLSEVMKWIDDKINLDMETVRDYCIRSGEVERNCEIRAVQKIKDYNLPFDIEKYSKDANAYIAFYWAMPELKSWCNTSPYHVKEIMDSMPTTLDIDHAELAQQTMGLYHKYCLEEGNEDC